MRSAHQEFENLDYPTALRRLADICGIPVIEQEEDPEELRRRRLRAKVVQLNELAAQFYHTQLCRSPEAQPARDYLKQRGVNIQVAKSWQLGWAAPDFSGLRKLALSRGFDEATMEAAYLVSRNERGNYPIFRDRLMFPIRNVRGEVVGFSGRVMQPDQDPRKYVNTAETVAFRKGELLFGLYKATAPIGKAGMQVVICEGQLDVIACHENADVRNAVAGLGTAFTEDHARTLAKYAKRAILCYDGDRAGMAASEKTYRKLAQAGLEVCQADLPAGEDPDSLIRSQGASALQQAIAEAQPYLIRRVVHELEHCGQDAGARAAVVPRMAELTAQIKDPIRRDALVVDLATRLNIGPEAFRSAVNTMVRKLRDDARRGEKRTPQTSAQNTDEQEALPAPEEQMEVVPLPLHNTISGLISMALSSKRAQELLLERIEDLQEPIRTLSGGIILQRLMEQLPAPGDEEALREFAEQLPPEQALALRAVRMEYYPEEKLAQHVNFACARAARFALQERIDALRGRIRAAVESPETLKACFDELQRLLVINDDTAP